MSRQTNYAQVGVMLAKAKQTRAEGLAGALRWFNDLGGVATLVTIKGRGPTMLVRGQALATRAPGAVVRAWIERGYAEYVGDKRLRITPAGLEFLRERELKPWELPNKP